MALIPLLGWFYLSLAGFFVAMLLLPKKMKVFVHKIFLLGFGCYALFLSLGFLRDEAAQFQVSLRSFHDTFHQKNIYEAGSYFNLYHDFFRPYVGFGDLVNLLNVPTREFYYARMYLFPAGVMQVQEAPSDSVLMIAPLEDAKHIVNAIGIATHSGKVLLRTPGSTP